MSIYLSYKCPTEVLDLILAELDLPSLQSLRLTCRSLAERCIGSYFLSFYREQGTDLSLESLERLCAIASHPRFGCAVASLMVTCLLYNTGMIIREKQCLKAENPDRSGEYWRGFETLAGEMFWQKQYEQENTPEEETISMFADALTQFKTLKSITLDGIRVSSHTADPTLVFPSRPKHLISGDESVVIGKLRRNEMPYEFPYSYAHSHYRCGIHLEYIHVFRIYSRAISAILRSEVELDALSVYRQARGFAVPTYELGQHLISLAASDDHTLASLQSVALNISNYVETDIKKLRYPEVWWADEPLNEIEDREDRTGYTAHWLDGYEPKAYAVENFTSLRDFLLLMPNVETIDLYLYPVTATDRNDTKFTTYDRLFSRMAEESTLIPRLRKCYLRGFYALEDSMIEFLENHGKIEELTLDHIHFTTSGNCDRLFRVLDGRMKKSDGQSYLPRLSKLHLRNLKTRSDELIDVFPTWGDRGSFVQAEKTNISCPKVVPCERGLVVIDGMFDKEDLHKGLIFKTEASGQRLASHEAARRDSPLAWAYQALTLDRMENYRAWGYRF